jgi:hypothetical protein
MTWAVNDEIVMVWAGLSGAVRLRHGPAKLIAIGTDVLTLSNEIQAGWGPGARFAYCNGLHCAVTLDLRPPEE